MGWWRAQREEASTGTFTPAASGKAPKAAGQPEPLSHNFPGRVQVLWSLVLSMPNPAHLLRVQPVPKPGRYQPGWREASPGLVRDWQGQCRVKSSGRRVSCHRCRSPVAIKVSHRLPGCFPLDVFRRTRPNDLHSFLSFFGWFPESEGLLPTWTRYPREKHAKEMPTKEMFSLRKGDIGYFEPTCLLGQMLPWALCSCPLCGAGTSLHPCATGSSLGYGNGKAAGTPQPQSLPVWGSVLLPHRPEPEVGG